jgi:hypothetical protein
MVPQGLHCPLLSLLLSAQQYLQPTQQRCDWLQRGSTGSQVPGSTVLTAALRVVVDTGSLGHLVCCVVTG